MILIIGRKPNILKIYLKILLFMTLIRCPCMLFNFQTALYFIIFIDDEAEAQGVKMPKDI